MRKLLAISAFALFFLMCPILHSANSIAYKAGNWDTPGESVPLEMRDLTIRTGGTKSVLKNQVFLGEDVLTAVFKKPGVVTVKITNEYNQIMYSKTILPSSTPKLYLSTTAYPNGNYTITFIEQAGGGTSAGDFTIMR